jgi:methylthioribose-1-phosphate isomerase
MVSAESVKAPTLEAIKYEPGHLSILDQLSLPHETKYVSVSFTQRSGNKFSLTHARSTRLKMVSTQ